MRLANRIVVRAGFPTGVSRVRLMENVCLFTLSERGRCQAVDAKHEDSSVSFSTFCLTKSTMLGSKIITI